MGAVAPMNTVMAAAAEDPSKLETGKIPAQKWEGVCEIPTLPEEEETPSSVRM